MEKRPKPPDKQEKSGIINYYQLRLEIRSFDAIEATVFW
jgi:hypothetical protein